MNRSRLRYIAGYNETVIARVHTLIDQNRLGEYLRERYSSLHAYSSDKALYAYVNGLKNDYLRNSPPLSKVGYDPKLQDLSQAMGTHTFVSRVQGGKLKAKNEIRIASVFRCAPEPFLRMIVVHELAHLREKEHNKAFYKLCTHIEPSYHQLEFDVRLFLTQIELSGSPYG